jgi:hypothetical protein
VEIFTLDDNTLLLHQAADAKKILNNVKMSYCDQVKSPLPRYMILSLMDCPDEVDPKLQQSAAS